MLSYFTCSIFIIRSSVVLRVPSYGLMEHDRLRWSATGIDLPGFHVTFKSYWKRLKSIRCRRCGDLCSGFL